MIGEPITDIEMDWNDERGLLLSACCPNCGEDNKFYNINLEMNILGDMCNNCVACGSKMRIAQRFSELLEGQNYFSSYSYSGKRVAVWGCTQRALFRLGINKKMKDAVVVVVDRAYRRFSDGFMGFNVQSPEVLADTDFDVLYVGSRDHRKSILRMAYEILGDEKEIMLLD